MSPSVVWCTGAAGCASSGVTYVPSNSDTTNNLIVAESLYNTTSLYTFCCPGAAYITKFYRLDAYVSVTSGNVAVSYPSGVAASCSDGTLLPSVATYGVVYHQSSTVLVADFHTNSTQLARYCSFVPTGYPQPPDNRWQQVLELRAVQIFTRQPASVLYYSCALAFAQPAGSRA